MTSALFLRRIMGGLPGAGLDPADENECGRAIEDRVTTLCVDGVLAGYDDDLAAAEALVDKAGHAAARLGDPTLLAIVAEAAGYLAVFDCDMRGAAYCFEDSLDSFRVSGGVPEISTLLGSALVHGLLGDEGRSHSRREEAFRLVAAHGETGYQAHA
ncbi:hypothetical protein FK531_18910 [Rhodococcus spelaei]|uniref:Uncharacterized protein n=1 Tax=Rhodococcus spelaei TaxID=2546320 RepID=A0A541B0V9_9NOCA|nr:hypothetical protein [Rhodococcus spelaei]TQF65955.1 hypothetical protein FK531_18910 [Rhodococcus spelaei]